MSKQQALFSSLTQLIFIIILLAVGYLEMKNTFSFHGLFAAYLQTIALFVMSFGVVRQSALFFVTGAVFSFLGFSLLVCTPLTMVPLGISLNLFISHAVYKFLGMNRFMVFLCSFVIAKLLLFTPAQYYNWVLLLGVLFLILFVVLTLKLRYKKQSLLSITLFAIIAGVTTVACIQSLKFSSFDWQRVYNGILYITPLTISGIFLSSLLKTETQLRSLSYQDAELSLKDPLTNILNRRGLDILGKELIQRSFDNEHSLSILMIDIDNFKQINDLYGHLSGDEILIKFANLLQSQIRTGDLVARYGGEEFVILLPGASFAPAMRFAEQLRELIQNNPFNIPGNKKLNITSSIGLTTVFPENALTFEQFLQKADQNLYKAKRNGKNQVQTDTLK